MLGILFLVLLFLICPFVELGIIIFLAIKNGQYKRENEELIRKLQAVTREGEAGQEPSRGTGAVRRVVPPAPVNKKSPAERPARPVWNQGTFPLVIGVVFVVLAGLIFATTTWNRLAAIGKVILVLSGSVTFFGASFIAVKKLNIKKTGKAFYVLGSIFLFLTVLAMGYFGMLGAGFTLTGRYRFFLLAAGIWLADGALFAGVKRFGDKGYIHGCFWGITVGAACLVSGFHPSLPVFAAVMSGYGIALVRLGEKGELAVFSRLNLWGISILVLAYTGIQSLVQLEVLLAEVISMGILTINVTVLAWKRPTDFLKAVHGAMLALFVCNLMFLLPMETEVRGLAVVAALGMLFFAGEKRPHFLKSLAGDLIDTVLILLCVGFLLLRFLWLAAGFDAWFLGTGALSGRQIFSWAACTSGAILILAGVALCWSRRIPGFRPVVAWIGGLLTFTTGSLIEYTCQVSIPYEARLFAYLLGTALWDLWKKDCFWSGILIPGTLGAVGMLWHHDWNLPYGFLMAGYLLLKRMEKPEEQRRTYDQGACLYLLFGIYMAFWNRIDLHAWRILVAAAAYLLLWIFWIAWKKAKEMRRFLEITGTVLFLAVIAAYYGESSLGIWYLILVLAGFAGIYLWCYQGNLSWLNLISAAAMLPLPILLAGRYELGRNQLYGAVLAAVLASGILMRWRYRIIEWTEDGMRADWYHMLLVLVLVPMQWFADDRWGFVYLLLLAAYAMQYVQAAPLKKAACTVAGILCILAFWAQPFIAWPDVLDLEIRLIPAALMVFSLGFIWGKSPRVIGVQTGLWLVCILALVLDAFFTQKVLDALMVEGVCLVIFLLSYQTRCRRWTWLSGIVIVSVAIYLTRSFWLSLSWWVYLLAAGIGLIAFAAINERKKSGK